VEEGGRALRGFSSGSGKGEEERMGGPGLVPRGRREMGERGPRRIGLQHEVKKHGRNGPWPTVAGDAVRRN
jgi:hypothetical protein